MKRRYYCPREFTWIDKKTGESVTVPVGYPSDGATGATDIWSYGWFAHDILCDRGTWDSMKICTPRDASRVLKDILHSEGRWFRAFTWGFFTYVYTRITGIGSNGEREAVPEKAGLIELIDDDGTICQQSIM
jgi:hypothetical protein